MENKIEIKTTMTVEELTEIINGNEAAEVATAFHDYAMKELHRWSGEYDRANNAEAELKRINAILSKAYLDQIEKK